MRLLKARFNASGSASTGGRFSARSQPDFDSFQAAREECQRIFHHAIQVGRGSIGSGEVGEGGKLIDQLAQCFHRGANHLRRAAQHLGRIFGEAAIDVAFNAFGGKRDRREGVFDFMGDALRDFFPRHLLLRAQHVGDVVHHHKMPVKGTAQAE